MVISPSKESDLVQFQWIYLFISHSLDPLTPLCRFTLHCPAPACLAFPHPFVQQDPDLWVHSPLSPPVLSLYPQDTLCITQCPKYSLVISSLDGTWLTACSCTLLALRIKHLPKPEPSGSVLIPNSDSEEGSHNPLWNLVLKLEVLTRGYDLK